MTASDTGRIFDIRRFSTHDGGGIRTTVFFKGCPMQCAWCHNPEGISPARRPVWFSGSCIRCGSCVSAARAGGIIPEDAGLRLDVHADEDWDKLMDECPTGALRWDSRDVSLDELMDAIRRDKPFYVHGGGGVTLSGGDPLMQAGFARALLDCCRLEGIHTALETELYAPWEAVRSVTEAADLVYADLKIYDGQMHRRFTGADNDLILDNFRRLLAGDVCERVIVRTPMIPGITATKENIGAISRFLAALNPEVRLELLNYNPLAPAKYPLTGRKYCFEENPPKYMPDEMEGFRDMARKCGLANVLID